MSEALHHALNRENADTTFWNPTLDMLFSINYIDIHGLSLHVYVNLFIHTTYFSD